MVGKAQKSDGTRSELDSVFVVDKVDRWNPIRTSTVQSRSRPHAISGLFQPWKGRSEARNSEVINGLQHVFEKWVERCKKCIACQGSTSKKRPWPRLHKVPIRSNKLSPRSFQKALVFRPKLKMYSPPISVNIFMASQDYFSSPVCYMLLYRLKLYL
jgi:hypothetical protein